MKPEEAIEIMKLMQAQVEWDYPMDYAAAVDIAIDALKKQIPKEPTEGSVFREEFRNMIAKKNKDMASITGSCCPTCGIHIGESESILKKKNYMPYCKWCGQALKQPGSE